MKPLAFRIRDFRSIIDTGIVPLSGDNITVLAGQNEAGKTAVLLALRDFDLETGEAPLTPEFMPEANFDARPRVAVQFRFEDGELDEIRAEFDSPELFDRLATVESLWVERDLLAGEYTLDPALDEVWSAAEADRARRATMEGALAAQTPSTDSDSDGVGEATHESAGDDDEDIDSSADEDVEGSDDDLPKVAATKQTLAAVMHAWWPTFVYFDSFQDTLPRQVDVQNLLPTASRKSPATSVSQSVYDFLALADVDPLKVKALETQDKALGNYLQSRGALITGDFLTYWQQKVGGTQNVNLQVRHARDASGALKLSFYVRDQVDQYPEQRSKGFLWFLSFFLRLAAEQKRRPDRTRVLLIDEPGSYLHARAQRDVLHLFESRIAKTEPIVYSSHSPYLIPPERLHRVRVVMKTRDGGTRVFDRLTHPELRGSDFADTLTPFIQAIGIDITQALSFARPENLLVEGITDHIYITNWAKLYRPKLCESTNVFPGFGATTLLTLSSLFIGWGLPFVVLLDRDTEGTKTRGRLMKELLVPDRRVVQPRDAVAIEDLFSPDDFRSLLTALDSSLTLIANETPTTAVKRQNVDKVLLARTYAERVGRGETAVTKKTQERIERLLDDIVRAAEVS